ncbi:MAG: hypothetical protein KatS3mg124_1540 [Porticoccaceae bacterium]|nr:MAG: hypothetical protein KatS3mg124_1540 [Porticoccaceae bacterium]
MVVDSRARTPATARLFAAPGPVAVATAGPAGPWPPGTLHLPLPDAEGRVDLVALLAALAERECNQVLVEAGPRLLGALLRAGLVDRLVVYLAPKLLGSSARPLAEFSVARLAEALELAVEEIRPVGRDLRLTARVEAA